MLPWLSALSVCSAVPTEYTEHITHLGDVKTSIAQLYSALNVEQHQLEQEKKLLASLEELQMKLQPLEQVGCARTPVLVLTSANQNAAHG